ncbi:hypothetical protein [Paenibacillus sp. yr247]|uniref:hypothetical protein n=1 Tax=Paenibacillus sp. yr247 TaxID=1761880 RepID=UPI000B80D589|nr:hypothetical protein [Paenibacillus sp. yr247]
MKSQTQCWWSLYSIFPWGYAYLRRGEKLGSVELINVKHYHIYFIMVGIAFILYAYQLWQERGLKKLNHHDQDDITVRINTPNCIAFDCFLGMIDRRSF